MTERHNGKGKAAYKRARARLLRETREQGLPCHICGGPIDTDLPAGLSQSFTADHMEALANGGHLVRNELRPAHMGCNARRGNTADAEIWGAT